MTPDPTAVVEKALSERGVETDGVAEEDGELMVVHTLSSLHPDAITHRVSTITDTFVRAFQKYEDLRSLEIILLNPDRTLVQSHICEEEWAEESAEALDRTDELIESESENPTEINDQTAARVNVVTKVLNASDGPYRN